MSARAFDMGWAGVAFKTICLMEIHEASPRFSALKERDGAFYGFKNIEQFSVHSLKEDLQTFRNLKRRYPGKVILASIMGRNEEEWTTLAQAVTQAGADVIECNFSFPTFQTTSRKTPLTNFVPSSQDGRWQSGNVNGRGNGPTQS